MGEKKIYITTTIPYVNAKPHLGHALEFVQADVLARYRRLHHHEVYFLSGTDENAIKNVQAAEAEGLAVSDLINRNSQIFKDLLQLLNISQDQFIRTTEERHRLGAQALWRATDKNDIYKKKYKGLYCVGCEFFYKPEELDADGRCQEHPNKPPEIVEEENYFFRLSKYEHWLYGLIESDQLKIIPHSRKNEMLAFIERGLADFSISRPVERSKNWGVPVPADPSQTIYVWYDALANYITALGYPDDSADLYQKFWVNNKNKLHVLGKGVAKFHAIYWLAMLKSAGLPLPTAEFVHGYLTVDGQKMSKTIGNVIDPIALVKKYGADAVRYYLLREIPATDDGDFSQQKFIDRHNGDLANGLGNFAARILALGEKEGKVTFNFAKDLDKKVLARVDEAKAKVDERLKEFRFHQALEAVWELIAFGNRYLNEKQPWNVERGGEDILDHGVFNCVFVLENVGRLLKPFLPATGEVITESIQWREGHLLAKRIPNLFPRIK